VSVLGNFARNERQPIISSLKIYAKNYLGHTKIALLIAKNTKNALNLPATLIIPAESRQGV
jgi:hypothetical protein